MGNFGLATVPRALRSASPLEPKTKVITPRYPGLEVNNRNAQNCDASGSSKPKAKYDHYSVARVLKLTLAPLIALKYLLRIQTKLTPREIPKFHPKTSISRPQMAKISPLTDPKQAPRPMRRFSQTDDPQNLNVFPNSKTPLGPPYLSWVTGRHALFEKKFYCKNLGLIKMNIY